MLRLPQLSLSRLSPLGRAATDYAARGWPVFPLYPNTKRPIPLTGLLAATTDTHTVEVWWSHEPNANIALRTGDVFDVLDIDDLAAVVLLNSLFRQTSMLDADYYHDGPLSMTGKGWHLLFASGGEGNRANMGGTPEIPTKIDFRGTGGYIVAPPSIHPDGHAYQWAPDRGPERLLPPQPYWLRLLVGTRSVTDTRTPLLAQIDPTKPAITYLDLVHANIIPEGQLPHGLRRPNILDVCTELGLPLRRHRGYYQTTCIFHDDSTPSLTIYPHDNSFHCFGCGAHGDSRHLLNDPPTHV